MMRGGHWCSRSDRTLSGSRAVDPIGEAQALGGCPHELDHWDEEDPREHCRYYLRPPAGHSQATHSASSLGKHALLGKGVGKTRLDLSVADEVDVQLQVPDPSSSTPPVKIEWNCQRYPAG